MYPSGQGRRARRSGASVAELERQYSGASAVASRADGRASGQQRFGPVRWRLVAQGENVAGGSTSRTAAAGKSSAKARKAARS